jgi:uncharacterized protein
MGGNLRPGMHGNLGRNPPILFSEAISEYLSGAWHIRYHNVNPRTFFLTTLGGIAGSSAAVWMIGAFLSGTATKIYISLMAVLMGSFVLIQSYRRTSSQTNADQRTGFWKTLLLGFVCGFNTSGSGGGYGPLSTTGYMLMGLTPAVAVGTTILAKATNCILSIILWTTLIGIDWHITIPMSIGVFLGAPLDGLQLH